MTLGNTNAICNLHTCTTNIYLPPIANKTAKWIVGTYQFYPNYSALHSPGHLYLV